MKRQASAAWNRDVQVLERTLGKRQPGIRCALHALDDAAAAAIVQRSAITEDPTG